MTDAQLITIVITLVAILLAAYANRKSSEDMRDVLRAEMKAVEAELGAKIDKLDSNISSLNTRVAVLMTDHERRLLALERR